ncbi:Yip1 domain-containing protein [Arsukibacterium tuosuense]|uniref:Yip1 domain-containing protein n=1 Tax=Arsukibacterium tuosuense TaxID=1323745 RepID=A0A285IXV4_9GAMM|nr:YIP1 family protein [Arsukibacterium tuosuense]SNY51741.1 Yip1 domain-containing protein [Arsukibacterium tuosuense]
MSKNVGQALLDIYVAPKQVFNILPEKKGWSWIALLLILVVNVVGIWYFYSGMSPEWIVEQQIAQAAHSMTPAEIEQSRAVMGQMADKTGIISVAAILVMTPIIMAIMALYLMLVGNPGQKRPYGDWFAMAVWSNMPGVLNMLGLIILVLISSDPNLPLTTANYLSLNQLLFGLEPGHAWYAWAENFNLIYLWIGGLFAVGLHCWSGYSALKSALLGYAPLLVIYGLWAAFI